MMRLFAVTLMLVFAPALHGQVIEGRLVEGESRRPIVLGEVLLVDSVMTVIDQTFTDQEGRFRLQAPRPGSYALIAQRAGYHTAADGVFELGEGGYLPVDFYLQPAPIEVDPIVATVQRQRIQQHLEAQGFYERVNQGFGDYITPEDLEQRRPFDTADLLRSIPGIAITEDGIGSQIILFRRPGRLLGSSGGGCFPPADPPGFCTPRLFVDGGRVETNLCGEPGVILEDVVDVDDLAGVEVHRRATSVPLIYGGSEGGCGVILVWTKGGGVA